MKDRILFKGIFPALITPLNANGTVRTQAVAPIMKWMLSQQVNGFYVLGGTGEGAVLAERERMRMAEAAADVLQGTEKKLILHVGAADSREAQRLAAEQQRQEKILRTKVFCIALLSAGLIVGAALTLQKFKRKQ